MLGAWAEQTSRVEIGALVTCNSYRNPELLADMARTVDHISGGRLILGIGSGWFEKDYDEYGYEFGTAGGRLDALGRGPAPDRASPGPAEPAAHPRHPRADRRGRREEDAEAGGPARRHLARLRRRRGGRAQGAVLDGHCADVGRDPAEIERSVGVGGEPEENGQALLDLGVTLFTVSAGGPDYDLSRVRRWVRWRDAQQRG